MKTGLETKAWKILTRPLKSKISDEANAVLLLTALARAASADTNVSVPELKKVQETGRIQNSFGRFVFWSEKNSGGDVCFPASETLTSSCGHDMFAF